ncbi:MULTISPECIES: NAD(P)/FAD-dependent oxidoreductase [Mycolicibacterium]|uniref:Oxidoreductase n=2 Tax=Mycolicibacterium TaxID=1866885 RepID=A0AAD1M3X7_9MYCO|nr:MULTISPECIES: FAD-dependent oxidoreductase [Mycolicibacterium]MCV7042472.1 FAD-dependent oxidoreductase [Mycolicibacterium moriokaense]MCV7057783.1 FAD-dependent oxidoreductase [Mycolicibacterium gilvum]ORB22935.1 pyridine nucleotide-disulfide oxidoreductase [Mycolicibacterium moriokaense]STZ41123.1 Pyridine nucleotide-disulphide oxidoreductase family [Mycolicibacterium gilvum]BBW99145.1 oxidoreductase [Mycolicibacterium moriokaense]
MTRTSETSTIVIAGAGQAGSHTAASLREFGFKGRIVLVGDEPFLPYQRPPLSKGHLTGASTRESLWLHPGSFYEQHGIELLLAETVSSIDRTNCRVQLRGGAWLDYDHLVLALGAHNRALPVAGTELDGVVGLRNLAEADDIRARLDRARHVVVVGGGFIGLEVAATATRLGLDTVVIEISDRLMGRVLSPQMAGFLLDAHRSRGLNIELGTSVAGLTGAAGRVSAVTTTEGREFPADMVLVGIGAVPNTDLAEDAGLRVDNGIVVDEYLATDDGRISAVGDCTSCPNRYAGELRVRLESVHNATAQARVLAARLVGRPEPYDSVPWFWSDQADLKLQIAGLSTQPSRAVLRGDPASGRFSVFCFHNDVLRSVESLNRPGDHMAARKLLALGDCLTPEQANDLNLDLRAHITASTGEPEVREHRAPAPG